MTDNIKPDHYRKGEIDLFESWYRTRPFNEFRAIMESIAERYMKRDKEDRIQDLDKAMETLRRLKEYEEKEIKHLKEKETGYVEDKQSRNSKVDENIYLLKGLLERGFKYLARDKDEELWVYSAKPLKFTMLWSGVGNRWFERLGSDYFPEVKWSDEEPTKIADLLEIYSNGGENGKQEAE